MNHPLGWLQLIYTSSLISKTWDTRYCRFGLFFLILHACRYRMRCLRMTSWCFSLAAVKCWPKPTQGIKALFGLWVIVHHQGNWVKNSRYVSGGTLKQRPCREVSYWLTSSSYLSIQLRTTYSGIEPTISISN